MTFEERQFGETSLDALVHVTEAFLEPQYLFTHDREAEVAGLDDAGMRDHRNLVHTVTFDSHERVTVDG